MRIILSPNQYSSILNEQPEGTMDRRLGITSRNMRALGMNPSSRADVSKYNENVHGVTSLIRGPKKGTSLEDAMETFREGLFSPGGMALEAFLTTFGWGAPVVMGAYAGMLSYDIYKSLNGETDWFNIIVDTLGVVTSGAIAGVFSPFIKAGKKGFSSIKKVFEWLKTTNIWKTIKPYLSMLVKGINEVGKWISKGLKWIADNTGLTFLMKFSGSIVSFFNKITSEILEVIGQVTQKVTNKIVSNPKVGIATKNAVKVGTGQEVLNVGLETEPAKKLMSNLIGSSKIDLKGLENVQPTEFDKKVAADLKFD